MTFHGKVQRKDGEERDVQEHLVKVFSYQRVEDEWLEEMFGEGQVTWVYRKEVCIRPAVRCAVLADTGL